MPFFITVVIDGLAYVFSITAVACPTGGVGYIDTSSQGAGVLPSLWLAMVPLLLLCSLLIRGFAGRRGV